MILELVDKMIREAEQKGIDTAKMKIVLSFSKRIQFINEVNLTMPLCTQLIYTEDVTYRNVRITDSAFMPEDKIVLMPITQLLPE